MTNPLIKTIIYLAYSIAGFMLFSLIYMMLKYRYIPRIKRWWLLKKSLRKLRKSVEQDTIMTDESKEHIRNILNDVEKLG